MSHHGLVASHKPNTRRHWHDPLVYAGVVGSTALIRGLGPAVSRSLFAEVGDLYSRAPMNRHRIERAIEHIRWCFPELTLDAARKMAHESYRHMFLLAAEGAMSPRHYDFTRWPDWVELGKVDRAVRLMLAGPTILITAHLGNWEMLGAWLGSIGLPMHAVYRPLDSQPLNNWATRSRAKLGLDLVDKFGASEILPDLLRQGEPIGFTADQDAGERGLFVPFFNRLASTYKSIGLLALRHNAPIICGGSWRLTTPGQSIGASPMRFHIDAVDIITPGDWADQPDPLFYITARYRRAIETMIRQAPEQYLWMQKAWRSRPRFERLGRPMPSSLRTKLEALPWMTDQSLSRLMTQSQLDTKTISTPPATPTPAASTIN